jgi:lipopolysaccharide biosynthesis glycosyltransferase
VDIAMVTDPTYLPWCATAIRSCIGSASLPEQVRIHLLHTDTVDPRVLSRLGEMVEEQGGAMRTHTFHEGRLRGLPTHLQGKQGWVTWARVLLPDVLSDLERVVYLDADTLVTDSLEPLWSHELTHPVGAVANVLDPSMDDRDALGLRGAYFNAGVLLIDLERWRSEGVVKELVDFGREHPELVRWSDQDALNSVFDARWDALHPRWNVMNSFFTWPNAGRLVHGPGRLAEALASPAIVHFEGPEFVKPWHQLSNHPHRRRYRQTLSSTPFAPDRLEGATSFTRALSLLPGRPRMAVYVASLRLRAAARRRSGSHQRTRVR